MLTAAASAQTTTEGQSYDQLYVPPLPVAPALAANAAIGSASPSGAADDTHRHHDRDQNSNPAQTAASPNAAVPHFDPGGNATPAFNPGGTQQPAFNPSGTTVVHTENYPSMGAAAAPTATTPTQPSSDSVAADTTTGSSAQTTAAPVAAARHR